MNKIPDIVGDEEILNRRIHPTFCRPDGHISSQAFRDQNMSVDRASYRDSDESLSNYAGFGLAGFQTGKARMLDQEVVSAKELLNPAHALVMGHKSKAIARKIAESAVWIVSVQSNERTSQAASGSMRTSS